MACANQPVNLAWDAPVDPSVVGYWVYYGPASHTYTNRLNAGAAVTITTPALADGSYYFTATAYDIDGIESDFANEIATNIVAVVTNTSPPVPFGPSGLVANADGSITLGWNVTAGTNYTLQYKSNLLDSTWMTLGSFTASSNVLSLSDHPGTTPRFYQLSYAGNTGGIVGVLNLSLLGNSDNVISIPFARPGAVPASVASVSGNVIAVDPSWNWSPGQFVYTRGVQSNIYYARFTSGGAEGRIYRITNNTANTLSVDVGTDAAIAGATLGDSIAIEPYWTLGTVFPNGRGVNISPTDGNRNTELLVLPSTSNPQMNSIGTKIYYFNAGIWKQLGQGNTCFNDDVLPPNSCFIVRHSVATDTTLTTLGVVVTSKLVVPLQSIATDSLDNPVGLMRPVPVSLSASGLISSGAFRPTLLPGSRIDQLLTFDNTIASRNRSESAVFFYWNSMWRQVGAGPTNAGLTPLLGGGTGFVIRKATNGATVFWTNAPNY